MAVRTRPQNLISWHISCVYSTAYSLLFYLSYVLAVLAAVLAVLAVTVAPLRLSIMPRHVDLELYRDQISSWVLGGMTQADVLARLKEAGVDISHRTLQGRLQAWDIKVQPKIEDTPALRQRVIELFWSVSISDATTVAILQLDGYQITQRGLQRLRWKLGLLRRVPKENQEAVNETIRVALMKEYEDGRIQDYGKVFLSTFMRSEYNFIGRCVTRSSRCRLVDACSY